LAVFSKIIITKSGQELISRVLSGLGDITFTKVSSSDRVYETAELLTLDNLEDVRQSVPVSSIEKTNDAAVKIEAVFVNTGLKEGYYLRTLGLYAKGEDGAEILFAATSETSGNCFMPPFNSVTSSSLIVNLITAVGNAENVSIEVNPAAIASAEDLNLLKQRLEEFAETHERKVISERIRDPNKPDYGLGGGGDWSGALEVSSYSGNAEVTVVLNGTEYDGDNISRNAENAPDGTIIIKEI